MSSITAIVGEIFSKGLRNTLDEIQSSPEFQSQPAWLENIFVPTDTDKPATGPGAHCRPGFERWHPAFDFKTP